MVTHQAGGAAFAASPGHKILIGKAVPAEAGWAIRFRRGG
jgi:hypothetical protein